MLIFIPEHGLPEPTVVESGGLYQMVLGPATLFADSLEELRVFHAQLGAQIQDQEQKEAA